MANVVKSYFLPPEWTFKPGGRIFLGSVISNPKTPEESLSPNSKKEGESQEVLVDDEQFEYEATIKLDKNIGGGIDLSFLSMFGAGASLEASRSKATTCTLKAKRLKTIEIKPSLKFLTQALAEDEAVRFLKKGFFRPDVYCIVGLMIGEDMTISTKEGGKTVYEGSVQVSAAPFSGVPIEAGPKIKTGSGRETTVSAQRRSEVIVGYRLRRITYSKNEISSRPHRKGAALAPRREEVTEEAIDTEYYAEADQLDEDEVCADDFDFASVTAEQNGPRPAMVELVVPQEA